MAVVQWQTAAPLWQRALEDDDPLHARFRQPALFRFATDSFMEEFQTLLNEDAAAVADYVARRETWREPAAGWQELATLVQGEALKLYQPVQERFYLVGASLVCRMPGLPDRTVDTANQERVFFVLRKLVSNELGGYDEYAWCQESATRAPDDPHSLPLCSAVGWQPVGETEVLKGEERLPLFPVTFSENGQRRRLWAGLIPTSSREGFETGGEGPLTVPPDIGGADPLADPRLAHFQQSVMIALVELEEMLRNQPDAVTEAEPVLLFALLDLGQFVHIHLNGAWDELPRLDATFFGALSWEELAQQAAEEETAAQIESGELDTLDGLLDRAGGSGSPDKTEMREALERVLDVGVPLEQQELEQQVEVALQHVPQDSPDEFPPPTVLVGGRLPRFDPGAGALYVIRCVYERPCGLGVRRQTVSSRSQPFQIASLFDSDAPARSIQIPMPVDISIEELRKFPKNVSVMISKELRKQMERVQGLSLSDLDEGNLKAPGTVDLGMICSFSIPIITICALILLMIMVQLLNIVFWWLPFFQICLPLDLGTES